ncbi:MAG: PAS domain-containing sensor histidine kinase [Chitinophagaceae bacterium]|nr:MAG: PAS domain-containing sensor histidine kinase [Chitinophagaceae bacterium]
MPEKENRKEISPFDLPKESAASQTVTGDDALFEKDTIAELEDLKKRFDELKFSEERYHRMVSEVQDYAIILLDSKGKVLNWNRGAEKIKQYKESEILGKPFQLFYLPEDREAGLPERLLGEAVLTGRATHEGWRLRKDKTRFWGSVALTALHDDNNEVIGFSKVTRDLTEKKLAEDQLKEFTEELTQTNEALRKSEERYQKMIAEIEDYAIILLNQNGYIENWNAGAQKIKGYSAMEIIGRHFSVFYAAKDKDVRLPDKLLAEARTKGKAMHEGWRIRKDGTQFWGSIVITALHANDGTIIGFSKVTRDLTERKTAEDKLQAYLRELEVQNAELEQFAYVASHDLQEPLRKIQTFADIIRKNLHDQTAVSKYLDKLNASAVRMKELIRSVLNYSRISKNGDEKTETDLNVILTNVIEDFELLIEEKKGKVEADLLPVINAIPLQINQLFSNILGNALKYCERPPFIQVKRRFVSANDVTDTSINLPGGSYLEIQFIDNGIGFEQRYEKIIFSMFQRLHGKHEYSGTGIGLALCKKIMDSHNGYITARSELSFGSIFYVYFPV